MRVGIEEVALPPAQAGAAQEPEPAEVVDRAVLAERRARPAELVEEELARRAAEAERAAAALEAQLSGMEERLREVMAERDAAQTRLHERDRALLGATQREHAERALREEAEEERHQVERALLVELADARARLAETEERAEEADQLRARVVEADALRERMAAAQTERSALAERLAAAESERTELTARLDAAQEQGGALSDRVATLKAERDALAEQIATVEAERDALAERIARLEAQADAAHGGTDPCRGWRRRGAPRHRAGRRPGRNPRARARRRAGASRGAVDGAARRADRRDRGAAGRACRLRDGTRSPSSSRPRRRSPPTLHSRRTSRPRPRPRARRSIGRRAPSSPRWPRSSSAPAHATVEDPRGDRLVADLGAAAQRLRENGTANGEGSATSAPAAPVPDPASEPASAPASAPAAHPPDTTAFPTRVVPDGDRYENEWLAEAVEAIAADDTALAAEIVTALLPAQRHVFHRSLRYDLTLEGAGTLRVVLGGGEASVESRSRPAPGADGVDFSVAGPVRAVARLATGSARWRLRGARVEGSRRRLWRLLRARRAPLSLTALARGGERLDPGLVFTLLARAVDRRWTDDHPLAVTYRVTGDQEAVWHVATTGGAPLTVTDGAPDEAPEGLRHAVVEVPAQTFLPLVAREPLPEGTTATVTGDPAAVARLHAWFDRVQGLPIEG